MKNYIEDNGCTLAGKMPTLNKALTLRETAEQVLSKTYDVLNTADGIHEKLYGPEPETCETPINGREPQGLLDTLKATENNIDRFNHTLQDIVARL